MKANIAATLNTFDQMLTLLFFRFRPTAVHKPDHVTRAMLQAAKRLGVMLQADVSSNSKAATEKADIKLSRNMARVLRHDEHFARTTRPDGCVPVDWLLKQQGFSQTTNADIERVICNQDNEDLRFGLKIEDTGKYVYCFQGHDAKYYAPHGPIQLDQIFRRLTSPIEAIHSTRSEYVNNILKHGLMFQLPEGFQGPGKRHEARFVHMWNRTNSIKKGRKNADAWIQVDMATAMEQGIEFYIAGNGVILATASIPSQCLSDISEQMQGAIESRPLVDTTDDETYVSWQAAVKDPGLTRQFGDDLLLGAQTGSASAKLLLTALRWKLNTAIFSAELRNYLDTLPPTGKKNELFFDIYPSAQLQGLYMIMINGRKDSEMVALAQDLGLPRGLPVLWQPQVFMDIRGFYPKFANDGRGEQVMDPKLFHNALEVRFFLKWSGFLLHVLAFKYDEKVYWTVCTKKVAFNTSSYIQWGYEGLKAKMQDEDLRRRLATERTYIGVEMLCTQDVHGYIVKSDDKVVTCVGNGSYVDLQHRNHIDRYLNGQPRLVTYMPVDGIVEFCTRNRLPYDTGYTISATDSEALKQFMGKLFEARDTMKCSDFRNKIPSLSSPTVTVTSHPGSASHETIVGENLEGFVMNIQSQGITGELETCTYKIKLPFYTWRTFFLRTQLKTLFEKIDLDQFSVKTPCLPDVQLVSPATAASIEKYVDLWCCTTEGKTHFKRLCKCAMIALRDKLQEVTAMVENKGYRASHFSTGADFRDRVHILVADYAESLDPTTVNAMAAAFDTGLDAPPTKPTVFICVGPVGFGKTVSTQKLAAVCRERGLHNVEVIDADRVAGTQEKTYALGIERNEMTQGMIWKSLMAGRIPLVSMGGGQIVDYDTNVCVLRDRAREIFGCELNLVTAIMQDVSTLQAHDVKEITEERELGKLDGLVHGIYNVDDKYTQNVMTARQTRGEKIFIKLEELHKISRNNVIPALAILKSADHIFQIPCDGNAANPMEFIQNDVGDWQSIAKRLGRPPGEMPGTFTQVRAVVFEKAKFDEYYKLLESGVTDKSKLPKIKAHHITLKYAKERLNLTSKELDDIHQKIMTIMDNERMAGRRCKLCLKKTDQAATPTTPDSLEPLSEELSMGLTEPEINGTRMASFETREKGGITLSDEEAKADVDAWSWKEVAEYHLTDKMMGDKGFKYAEEQAVWKRKQQLSAKIKEWNAKSPDDAHIEAVYLPALREICKDRKPHATISASKVYASNSDMLIRWFLSTHKPLPLVLQGEKNNRYEFVQARPKKIFKELTNPNEIRFHSNPKTPFKKGDLLEKIIEVPGNCELDDVDTEFIYVGIVPIK